MNFIQLFVSSRLQVSKCISARIMAALCRVLGRRTQIPRASIAFFSAKAPEKQTWEEFFDRSARMLFMTEIFRAFWLTAEAATKPKVIIAAAYTHG